MFRTLLKLYHKKKAISPVISAILLIGLAVAAGAILIVVVLPLLTPAANVEVQAAAATDRNNDGEIDRIVIQLSNAGTTADTISTFTADEIPNWDTDAAGLPIPPSTTDVTDVTFSAQNVDDQLGATAAWTITLTMATGKVLTVQRSDETTTTSATSMAEGLMLIDFTSSSGTVIKTNTDGSVHVWQGTASGGVEGDRTHSDKPGLQVDADTGDPDTYFAYVATASGLSDGDDREDMDDHGNQLSSAIWDKQAKPYLRFWIKSDRLFPSTAGNNEIQLRLTAYDGSSEVGDFSYDIDTRHLQSDDDYNADSWLLIELDLSSDSGWNGYSTDEQDAQYCGGFMLRFRNDNQGSDWDLYLDDVFVYAGF